MSELPRDPRDPNLRRSILGAILLDQNNFAVAAEELNEFDFPIQEHRDVFRAMTELDERHEKIEAKSLFELLKGNELIEKAGGEAFLESLDAGIYKAAPVRQWCRTVKDQSRQWQIVALGYELETRASEKRPAREIVAELLAHTEDRISEIREGESGNRAAMHVSDICKASAPTLEMLGSGKGQRLGRPTGLPELDRVSNGLIAGEYWLVGARPSIGKSALGLDIALRQAKQGSPVAIFSLEMSKELVLLRLICMEAKVSFKLFIDGRLGPQEWRRIARAVSKIAELSIWIDDRSAPYAHDLQWRIRSLCGRINAKLCVVDYIQLVRGKGENRTEQVTEVSMRLKSAAKEIGDTVGATLIAVSQLNRLAANEEPQLHHLLQSSQLEFDADVVLLMWNRDFVPPDSCEPAVKMVKIAKQRNGPIATIQLLFLPEIMAFDERSVGQQSYAASGGADA
jgi:replicative DNA helicase